MGSLIEYFKEKTAENAIEKSIKHSKKAQKCVTELQRGMRALLIEKDYDGADKIFEEIDVIESEADTIRREILEDISKGELNPSVRMDLSHLIKRIDDVANCANGVGRRIGNIDKEFWNQSSQETIDYLLQEIDKTVECAELLDVIIVNLATTRNRIKELAISINKIEHEVDVLSLKVRASLQKTNYSINIFTGVLIDSTLTFLDSISDSIEEVADYIQLLTVSKR